MPAPTYTVPTANSPTATEEPKIITALAEIKALLNAGLDDDNFEPGAQFPPSRIDDATAGQLLIASSSGVWTARTVIGDLTLDDDGTLTIDNGAVDTQHLADGAVEGTKLAPNSVDNSHLTTAAVEQENMHGDSVGAPEIIANSVGASEIGSLPTVRAHRTAPTSNITDSTTTSVPFDGEAWDTEGMHDNSTNPERITCVTPGVYMVTAAVRWSADGDGRRELRIVSTNAAGSITAILAGTHMTNPPNTDTVDQNVAAPVKLAVGDYVRAQVWHSGGGGVTLAAETTHLSATWQSDG